MREIQCHTKDDVKNIKIGFDPIVQNQVSPLMGSFSDIGHVVSEVKMSTTIENDLFAFSDMETGSHI